MAVSKSDYRYRFEQECKEAFDGAVTVGDFRRAEEIRRYYEERKYDMEGGVMNSILGASLTTGVGVGQIVNSAVSGTVYQSALRDFVPEFGVLYLNSKELPADWAGAKVTEFQRRATDKSWHVQFLSKWDKALSINLYLDIEEYNGKEVNEMARTYMEALNQRRVG